MRRSGAAMKTERWARSRAQKAIPPINQSARLAAGRCSCYVRSVGCEEHDMRLMIAGTDGCGVRAALRRRGCLPGGAGSGAAGGRHGVPTLRQSKELRLWAPGRLHPLQPALVGDLWHGYGRYQTAADPLVPRDASDDEHQAGNLGDRTRPPAGRPTAWYLHKRLRHAMTEHTV